MPALRSMIFLGRVVTLVCKRNRIAADRTSAHNKVYVSATFRDNTFVIENNRAVVRWLKFVSPSGTTWGKRVTMLVQIVAGWDHGGAECRIWSQGNSAQFGYS